MTEHDPDRMTANNMMWDIMGGMGKISAVIFNTIYNRYFDHINDIVAKYLKRREKMFLHRVAAGCYKKEIEELQKSRALIEAEAKARGFVQAEIIE